VTLSTTTASAVLSSTQIADLVELPLTRESAAMQSSTIVRTNAFQLKVPLLSADASTAAFTPEGSEAPVAEPTTTEVVVPLFKITALSVLTKELVSDAEGDVLGLVGRSLVRSLVNVVDTAAFSNTTVNGFSGLASYTTSTADAGAAFTSFDTFEYAKSVAEQHGTTVSYWVCNPTVALALSTVKAYAAAQSNMALLQPSVADPAGRQISGVPLIVSPSVPAKTVWALLPTGSSPRCAGARP
jgi:HK97 family phage major capsid protein